MPGDVHANHVVEGGAGGVSSLLSLSEALAMKQKVQPYERFLRRVTLERILSFGPSPMVLDLGDLNVLIGPNASGKSNLIEAISLMRATPVSASSNNDLRGAIRRGGGVSEWLWKGESAATASIDFLCSLPQSEGTSEAFSLV